MLVEVVAGAGVHAFDAEGQALLRAAKAAWDEDLSRHTGKKVRAVPGCVLFWKVPDGQLLARSFSKNTAAGQSSPYAVTRHGWHEGWSGLIQLFAGLQQQRM